MTPEELLQRLVEVQEQQLAETKALRAELAQVAPRMKSRNPHSAMVTKSQTCRELGIDRKTALVELIRDGVLEVVQKGSREAITRESVERAKVQGWGPKKKRARVPRPRVGAMPPPRLSNDSPGASILALKV